MSDSNRETGVVWSPSDVTHLVAYEASLSCSQESGEGYSFSPSSPSASGLVAKREQCSSGLTIASPSTHSTNFYRHLKRRMGRTLWRLHGKRRLVRSRKSPPHQPFGAKSSFSWPSRVLSIFAGTRLF